MTKLLQRVEVSLRSFYIFNSRFGKTDGEEHKKIVYYYPDDIEINTKIKDVGLSEAIIAFTSTFTEECNDCESLFTQKTAQIFFQPELDYWIVLVLNVPKEIRSKDGIEVAEYRGGEVHERIYRAMLEQCYNMFRLYHGTIGMNYAAFQEACGDKTSDSARIELQKCLSAFFDKYLQTLKFPACDVMEMSRSLQYLALDKLLFLNAHNFVNSILATFPIINEAILLYKEHVVCGGTLNPLDLYCLHNHILDEELLSKMPLGEVSGSSGEPILSRSDSTITDCYLNGAFITNNTHQPDESDPSVNSPSLLKLYLSRDNELVPFYFIVYRALDSILCLFMPANKLPPGDDFYSQFHTYAGPKLTSISEKINESISNSKKVSNGTKQTLTTIGQTATGSNTADANAPKYIFVNQESFKHLSNISIDRKRPQLSLGNASANVLQIIADLDRCDISPDVDDSSFKETLVKTTNDFWIVRRSCNWRKYYVIIFNTKLTLLDVTTEAMRVFDQEIPDDVFFYK